MARKAGWSVACVLSLFGVVTVQGWGPISILGFVLHQLPLLAQFTPWPLVRFNALCLGAFVALQTGLPYVVGNDYITLSPRMLMTQHVTGDPLRRNNGIKTVTTDAMGFRTSGPIDYAHKSSFRLAAIGGSTTEEIHIDDRETWTRLLADRLARAEGRPVEMINTGVSGLRARHHLATLKKLRRVEPDLVTILVGVNDWNYHIATHFKSWGTHRDQVGPPNGLHFRNSPLAGALRLLAPPYSSGPTVRTDRISHKVVNKLALPDRRHFVPDHVLPTYAVMLDRISDTCRAAGLRCVFISQPHAYHEGVDPELAQRFWMTPPHAPYTMDLDSLRRIASLYNTYLMGFAAARGHLACDLASTLAPTFDTFIDDVHFNEGGSRQVADELFKCLSDHRTELAILAGAPTQGRP